MNISPTTLYQGQPIGNYDPAFNYAADHPYHHSHFQFNNQPLGQYQSGTQYPVGHPYSSFGTSIIKYSHPLQIPPTTLHRGQPIGVFNPSTQYEQGHPYHHSNFQWQGQPLGPYQAGNVYPENHPYFGFGNSASSSFGSVQSGLSSNSQPLGQTSGFGAVAAGGAPPLYDSNLTQSKNLGLGKDHGMWNNNKWTGGFMNVSPSTQYNGKEIGNFDPEFSYPEDHPYHHRNFQHDSKPLGSFQRGANYPAGHPYYGIA